MKPKVLILFLTIITITSCNNEPKPLQVPSEYTSLTYQANTNVETQIRASMSALTSYMKKGDKGELLTTTELENLFTPLSTFTSEYYKNKIKSEWFPTLANNSTKQYIPSSSANGGVYGGRLLDAGGKETLQEIEKGLFIACLYHQLTILADNPTVENIDRMISLFGASPAFPNTNTATKTPSPDAFIALYAARRDKADDNGLYTKIRDQFIRLKAAVEGGKDYNKDRDQAIADIKLTIEKSLLATTIHYGFTATTKLTKTNPIDTDISGGLHDLSEGIGFVHGWKAIPTQNRKITDAQIDQILTLLNSPAGAPATVYKFATEGTTSLQQIPQMIEIIKGIYGFTDQEIEDFRNNWISIQGR